MRITNNGIEVLLEYRVSKDDEIHVKIKQFSVGGRNIKVLRTSDAYSVSHFKQLFMDDNSQNLSKFEDGKQGSVENIEARVTKYCKNGEEGNLNKCFIFYAAGEERVTCMTSVSPLGVWKGNKPLAYQIKILPSESAIDSDIRGAMIATNAYCAAMKQEELIDKATDIIVTTRIHSVANQLPFGGGAMWEITNPELMSMSNGRFQKFTHPPIVASSEPQYGHMEKFGDVYIPTHALTLHYAGEVESTPGDFDPA